jgi:hypothetical protein
MHGCVPYGTWDTRTTGHGRPLAEKGARLEVCWRSGTGVGRGHSSEDAVEQIRGMEGGDRGAKGLGREELGR